MNLILFTIEIGTLCMCLVEGAPTHDAATSAEIIPYPDDVPSKYICDFNLWEQFKIDFNKSFANEDDEFKHLVIFCDNLRKIKLHNELYRQKRIGFKMGLNQFTDMTNLQFRREILGAKI